MQSVLIVDRSEETREVFSTALARRGLRAILASHPQSGMRIARALRPDLVVLDVESDNLDSEEIYSHFTRESVINKTPLLLLGTIRRNAEKIPGREIIDKPYHYGPLVRRIEELLNRDCCVVSHDD